MKPTLSDSGGISSRPGYATRLGASAGGALGRRMLPIAIVAPALLGWLCLIGQQRGHYGTGVGLAIFAVATIVCLVGWVWWSADQLLNSDAARTKAAEGMLARLRETEASEAKFRGLLEAAPDAVVIVDPGGKIALINSQTERLFGFARSELIGAPLETLVPMRFRSSHQHDRAGYSANPKVRALGSARDLHGLRKDGTEFAVEVSFSPLKTIDGIFVTSTIRDVTERRKTEEQGAQLAALVLSSDDAIIAKNLDGIITSWNEAAHQMFGYRPEEVIGQSVALLVPHGREDEQREVLRKLTQGEHVAPYDTVRRRKDGVEIHVSVRFSPVLDSEGHLIGASKIVRDISDRRRAEAALALAKDVAEASNRELEAFSYSVAHDLRAPLRAMSGFSELLIDTHGDKLDAEGRDWLQEISLNAKKMGELIDGLLALARLARSDVKPEDVDLSAVVRDAGARLRAGEPDRTPVIAVQEHLHAQVDPRLARALLENLLGNAWKFTSKVPAGRIEFGAVEKEGTQAFFVRDNGAGFDMAYAGKLFSPFQRLHTAEQFTGTGIGLATVQRIVRRHGGRIWAEGAVDRGATFYFTLSESAGDATT